MKFFIFIFIFSSCSFFNEYLWEGIEDVTTIEGALSYVYENIEYREEYVDFWQYPDETNSLKSGDCEDASSLLAYIFTYNVGLSNVKLVGCLRKTDMQPHIVVRYNDRIFEACPARELKNFYDEFYITNSMSLQNYIDIARFHHL